MEFVGIDKLSLLDYEDYISIVLFSPACNFRCPFCHNGDSVLGNPKTISFDEIYQFLKSRQGLVDAVVISGGEPTMMPELKERIIEIRKLNYKVKLDTNGTNPKLLKELIEEGLIDYVAMDIKNSEGLYPATCGVKHVDMDKIKESISILMENKIPYEFRTTLVYEFHNNEEISKMGELIKGAPILYLQKFVDREGVIQKGLNEISKEKAEEFSAILLHYVKEVKLRGY